MPYEYNEIYITLRPTVHTTLPVSSASQGVSFARFICTSVFKDYVVARPLFDAHLVILFKITVPVLHTVRSAGGSFFFRGMANKDHKSITEQIALLKSRGMAFKDEVMATTLLQNISYYRIKGYWWDMQSDHVIHQFYPNTIFEDVLDRYTFDRHLRIILFDAIERIEIGLRTKMVYYLSEAFGPLWYLNSSIVSDSLLHQKHLGELRSEFARSQEIFAINHRNNKTNEDPDVWIILEVASMGTLSKMYKNLHHQLPEKSKIANEMGLNLQNELSSWLEAITYTRNIVAHHSRLWSRNMVRRPMRIINPKFKWLQNALTPVQEKEDISNNLFHDLFM